MNSTYKQLFSELILENGLDCLLNEHSILDVLQESKQKKRNISESTGVDVIASKVGMDCKGPWCS